MIYRITKFDPKKRNNEGHFLDDSEWTAITDIGNPQYRNLAYDEYEKVETAYVESIQLILDEKKISRLEIGGLELHNSYDDFERFKKDGRLRKMDVDFNRQIKSLKNGATLNLNQLKKIIRLILRETVWMNLLDSKIKITFGYDYYMYVDCADLKHSTIKQIEEMGLFVG